MNKLLRLTGLGLIMASAPETEGQRIKLSRTQGWSLEQETTPDYEVSNPSQWEPKGSKHRYNETERYQESNSYKYGNEKPDYQPKGHHNESESNDKKSKSGFDPRYTVKGWCPLRATQTCYHGGVIGNPESQLFPLCWIKENESWACYHRQPDGSCFPTQFDVAMECPRFINTRVWDFSYSFQGAYHSAVTIDPNICRVSPPSTSLRGGITWCPNQPRDAQYKDEE